MICTKTRLLKEIYKLLVIHQPDSVIAIFTSRYNYRVTKITIYDITCIYYIHGARQMRHWKLICNM